MIYENINKRVEDPDKWRRSKASVLSPLVSGMIVDRFNQESYCFDTSEKPIEQRQVIELKVTRGDLRVVQTWRNRQGATLSQVDLSPRFHARCKSRRGTTTPASVVSPAAWVAISPRRTPVVHSLKLRIGYEKLQPLEFGDYDGDGESEALFQLDGYNRAGYVLLYSKLAKRTQFIWSFH